MKVIFIGCYLSLVHRCKVPHNQSIQSDFDIIRIAEGAEFWYVQSERSPILRNQVPDYNYRRRTVCKGKRPDRLPSDLNQTRDTVPILVGLDKQ